MDVVPVEKERWRVDPFAGIIQDGYLYGAELSMINPWGS
jgi:acetylornithine deacetylase/succinyl-diaminopimelate desuccinylase-like protein